MTCPRCESSDVETWDYDYGMDTETGYQDQGVRARCRDCGLEADLDDFLP